MGRSKRQKPPPVEALVASDYLPEIINEFLLRLPAKSLLRFRCVCKSWYAVISDPKFIQSHHNLLTSSNHRAKVFCRLEFMKSFHTLHSENEKIYEENLYFPRTNSPNVLCSCHGFVLLIDDWRGIFYLWNPSIRKYTKFLRRPYVNFPCKTAAFGLYYDSSDDDYKIIAITANYYFIYSLKNDSWHKKGGFPYLGIRVSPSVFTNGTLYWAMTQKRENAAEDGGNRSSEGDYDYDSSQTHEIMCFNPKEESFKIMAKPEVVGDNIVFNLSLLGDCLGLFCYSTSSCRLNIWLRTVHGYNDSSSWAKSIVISDVPDPRTGRPAAYNRVALVCCTQEGNMLLCMERGGSVLYNVKEKKFHRTRQESQIRLWGAVVAVEYVDSLLLPGVGDKPKRKWLKTVRREHTSKGTTHTSAGSTQNN